MVIAQQQQLLHLQRELDDLKAALRESDRLAMVGGQELSSQKARLDEQTKKLDEWDRRSWTLIALLIGAVLSLASGLIVALVKK